MNEPKKLPVVRIGSKQYFIDERLGELRNVLNPHETKVLTCRDCGDSGVCEFAFDPYNTEGDCFMMK